MLFSIPTLFWRVHETIIGTRFNIYVWLVISSKYKICQFLLQTFVMLSHQKYVTFDIEVKAAGTEEEENIKSSLVATRAHLWRRQQAEDQAQPSDRSALT